MNFRAKGVAAAFAALCVGTTFAEASIDKVVVRQNWPWSPDVKIEFALTGVNEAVDVGVALKADGVTLPVTDSDIRGKRFGLTQNGIYTLTVDTLKAFPKGNKVVSLQADLTVAPQSDKSKEVIYKIFDLKSSAHPVTDVTRGDLLNGKYGAVETDYSRIGPGYTTMLDDVIIWTGVTNYPGAKTDLLVLRKIPAGTFKGFGIGKTAPAENNMTWSFDYWIAVFETTQAQRAHVGTGSWTKRSVFIGDELPDQNVQNYYLYSSMQKRDATSITAGFFARLGEMFKVGDVRPYDFELPMAVQWLRAYHAGTEDLYCDGLPTPDNTASNDQFSAIANYRYNGGLIENADGSVSTNLLAVGQFRPNAYGLYDMSGNIRELTRDASEPSLTSGTDVHNYTGSSNNSVTYGGSYCQDGSISTTEGIGAKTYQINSAAGGQVFVGFRVCMQAMADGKKLIGLE